MDKPSPDNLTPVINIVTWFLLVLATLSVLTKLATKYLIIRKLTYDDYLIILSLVCPSANLEHNCRSSDVYATDCV